MKSVWQITFESWLLHCIPSEILYSTCDLHCLESFCMVWLFVICVIVCDVHLMVFILWVTNCGLWQTTVWSLQALKKVPKRRHEKIQASIELKAWLPVWCCYWAKKQPVESEDNFWVKQIVMIYFTCFISLWGTKKEDHFICWVVSIYWCVVHLSYVLHVYYS